jgi:hypothetical protein
MEHQLKIGMTAGVDFTAKKGFLIALLMQSLWDVECYGPDGKLKWVSLENPNVMTNEGLNHLLDVLLHGSTQISDWFVIPFENDYTPLATNTYASPGITECTAYNEANRVAFNEAAASGQSVTNSANKATFNMNATKTVYGAALVGGGTAADTKGDTAGGGILLCAAKFSASKPCESGDTLKITATVSAQNVT